MNTEINPPQRNGASSDIKETIEMKSIQDAKEHFEVVKQRLLNVSNWHEK